MDMHTMETVRKGIVYCSSMEIALVVGPLGVGVVSVFVLHLQQFPISQ
jgi:hypothetical protein